MTTFGMIQNGILNPHLLHLLARVRHTNTLVIADWAFPFWPQIETVDISLIKGVPTVLQVMESFKDIFKVGRILQAEEFISSNTDEAIGAFEKTFAEFPNAEVRRLPHLQFKTKVPAAIGLIRTGDPTPYGNVIIESI